MDPAPPAANDLPIQPSALPSPSGSVRETSEPAVTAEPIPPKELNAASPNPDNREQLRKTHRSIMWWPALLVLAALLVWLASSASRGDSDRPKDLPAQQAPSAAGE
jgi:hypothetical protein